MAQLRTIGTKGSDVYTSEGLENTLLALNISLIRGVSYLDVKSGFEAVLNSTPASQIESTIEDLIVLAFHVRDIRGGKGERLASQHLFKCLLASNLTRDITLDILDLVPLYGCWRDLFDLGTPNCGTRLVDIVEKQFIEDEIALAVGGNLSLLAKWMPREGHHDVTPFVVRLVPGLLFNPTRMKFYRKRLVRLNKALDTVEIKMCANQWSNIDPTKVPGRAMHKYSKAFLNEKGTMRNAVRSEVGLRYPYNPDRMICREAFQTYFQKTVLGELKAKSRTLFPHEIVKKALNLLGSPIYTPGSPLSDEMNQLEGEWKSMVDQVRNAGGLGRSLAMCDFSGSMQNSSSNSDTPYLVSLSLGLLISEVTTDEFKDTILSFDSRPKFHTFPQGGLFTKLASINPDLGQGLSTDFQAAMNLVLHILKEARARPGNEPENLIVLTDMAWDAACSSSDKGTYTGNTYRHIVKTDKWQTHVEMIREAFKRAGEDLWGAGNGWKMPRIVIWNLSANSKDFHATSETDGVVMLSGWSQNLFKVLQGDGFVIKSSMNALRAQLNGESYQLVRNRVKKFFKKNVKEIEDELFAYY